MALTDVICEMRGTAVGTDVGVSIRQTEEDNTAAVPTAGRHFEEIQDNSFYHDSETLVHTPAQWRN